MHKRNLTKKSVEEILNNFGLETEYASHTRMSLLSSSQRLKVVLALLWYCIILYTFV